MPKTLEECPDCRSICTSFINAMEKECSDCGNEWEVEDTNSPPISDALDGVVG